MSATMHVPYEKPFGEFLRFIRQAYPKAEYPEAFVPIIAQKATAGYVIEKYFPELREELIDRHKRFAYAISEPDWGNSPLKIKSELLRLEDGSYEIYAHKSFIIDADIGIFVTRAPQSGSSADFALVIVDGAYYRKDLVRLEMPEATYQVALNQRVHHYKGEFTVNLGSPPFCVVSKRDILLLARSIVFREQVAYAVLAAAEAAKSCDMGGVTSRLDLLCQRAKEEPGQDDIAVAREILSASIVHILEKSDAHGFWRWLGRFVKS